MAADTPAKIKTGIPGLDVVLRGGLAGARVHLLEGHPGTGKTTMAQCFLMQGARSGERCLYVALSESEEALRASAHSHGWSLDGVAVMEVVAEEALLERPLRVQTLKAALLSAWRARQRQYLMALDMPLSGVDLG